MAFARSATRAPATLCGADGRCERRLGAKAKRLEPPYLRCRLYTQSFGVENLIGTGSDEFVNLTANANGLVVDLGDGNDQLGLSGGINTLSVIGVEGLAGSDFGLSPGVDDVLTLSTTVTGLNISLGNGDNTMNLAAGASSFVNIYDVNHVNGSGDDDILTVTGAVAAANDLGNGDDTLNLGANGYGLTVSNVENINVPRISTTSRSAIPQGVQRSRRARTKYSPVQARTTSASSVRGLLARRRRYHSQFRRSRRQL